MMFFDLVLLYCFFLKQINYIKDPSSKFTMLRTLLCLLSLTLIVSGAEFSPGGGGDLLRVLVRTRPDEVITSSNTTLYRLSDQLTIQNTVSYDGHLTVLTATTSGHLFLCDSSLTCNLTTPNGNNVTINNFLTSGLQVTSVSLLPQSDPNKVYVYSSEINLRSNDRTFSIGTILIDSSIYSERRDIEETSIIQRTVVSAITTDRYVYYILNHNDRTQEEEERIQVRLVRICANDTGVTVTGIFSGTQHLINSYYELRLQCDTSGLSALSSAYISDVNGAHIIVSFSDMTGDHVLCDYKENVISSLFTDKFTECVSVGTGLAGRTVNQKTRTPCRSIAMSSVSFAVHAESVMV